MHLMRIVLIAVIAYLPFGALVDAAEPWAPVDAPRVVAAKDVTPSTHSEDSRILELILSPSARCRGGLDNDSILRLQYTIESSHFVVDYLPSTTLATEYADNIDVAVSVSEFSGRVFYSVNPRSGHATADARSAQSEVKYKLLPPADAIVESGFSSKGRGAFFTFRKNSQTTLSGRKDIALLLRVPRAFELDYLTFSVSGEMEYQDHSFSGGAPIIKEKFAAEFDIAFYLDNRDNSAALRKHAEDFVNDARLKDAAEKFAKATDILEKDMAGRIFSFTPQKLKDDVKHAREALSKARTEVRDDLRKSFNNRESTK